MQTLPVNFRKQDHSPAAIADAVTYAITVADGYVAQWTLTACGATQSPARRPLLGLRLLEVGPGPTLGVPVLLACAGATVTVADRFPAWWDADFHVPFFEALLARVGDRGAAYAAPLRRLLQSGAFVQDVVDAHALAAEETRQLQGPFDLVLSNAVLEHVEDLQITAASLAAITAPGGRGIHQVDLRDHRDFSRPLEFLTLPEDEFTAVRRESFCECGGRWRAGDVAAAFAGGGFTVQTHPNLFAEDGYIADVRPRLQPPYARLSRQELSIVSALFVMSRDASQEAR